MKKNIAILISSLAGGGAERVASNLSLHLSDEKYNKYIIVFDDAELDYPYDGQFISLSIPASSNFFKKVLNSFKRIYRLRKFKKQYNIHTTISLLSSPNIINILSKRNDKVIVSVRNYISKSSKGFYGTIFKQSIKLLYKKADAIVVVSQAIKSDLSDNFGLDESKIKVIYNPYDIKKITKLAEEPLEDDISKYFGNFPTITTVGSLTKQKGQWHLLRAFKHVISEFPDAKLLILGKGDLEDYLVELKKNLGLEHSVYFLGFQNNPFKYIKNSTLYVFPSLYEGFPNALSEAMACGVPVISSDCLSGPREIIAPNNDIRITTSTIEEGEYGILVPVCDGVFYNSDDKLTPQEEIMSRSIINLLNNTKLLNKYSKKAPERINHFNIEKIISEWESHI